MKKLIILFIIISLLIPTVSNADGMILPRPDYYMNETGQKAVIFYENGAEVMVLSVSFEGDARDFVWVVPVPSKPEVTKGSDEIFTSLAEIVRPVYNGLMPMVAEISGKADEQVVTVVETKKVDYYDIAVLQSTESGALSKWLNENGYEYPLESSYILNDYIENNWYFIAVKIDVSAVEASEVQQGLKQGHATPLKIEFASSGIIYPLRISSITTQPKVVQLSYNLFLNQARIKHLQNIGYEEIIEEKSGQKVIDDIIYDLAGEAVYKDSTAGAYPLIISETLYLAAGSRQDVRGLDQDYYRPQVESWFNDYFNRQGFYYNQYVQGYIPIHLYVIANHKKDVPGFTTSYANKIKKDRIENLAYAINGEPLIQPQNNKYWLTYLYRNMKTSEMTSDLVLRDAENNNKVAVGSPVPTRGWLSWLLIYSVCVIGWVFSPFGLMFIGFSVLQFLSKSRKAHIIAWVFQILSVVVSGMILAFCSLVLTGLGWYRIMSIYPAPPALPVYSFALPVMLAGLTVLAGCVVVMILQWRSHRSVSWDNTSNRGVGTGESVKIVRDDKKNKMRNNLPKPKKVVMLVW